MMEINEDEILLEQYFQTKNMSTDARNLCLYFIDKSKELDGSINTANVGKKYDLVNMNLNRIGNSITFKGFASNGEENKYLDGNIKKVNNGYYLDCSVYRLYEYLEDDDRDYRYSEYFDSKDDKLIRCTFYHDGRIFRDTLESFDISDVDFYIDEKVRLIRKK